MDPALATALGSPNGKGNRTNRYADYGFEVGGPIVKDHLWGWGSIGKTDVRILTIKQTPDRTILEELRRQGHGTGDPVHSRQLHVLQAARRSSSAVAPARRVRRRRRSISRRSGNGFFKGEGNFVVGQQSVSDGACLPLRDGLLPRA